MNGDKDKKWRGNGHKYLTQGLFYEEAQHSTEFALYTIMPWDKRINGAYFPSLHKLYVEMEDIAEFNFANKYFDSYQHWLLLKSKPFFKEPYARMVEELNAKLRGRAIKEMQRQLFEKEASQSTLKYLADGDYNKKAGAGRPSKKRKPASVVSLVKSDLDRIKS